MKHDFNHKAETFDSPKNIFLANLVCQAVKKQIDFLSDKEILDFGGGDYVIIVSWANSFSIKEYPIYQNKVDVLYRVTNEISSCVQYISL